MCKKRRAVILVPDDGERDRWTAECIADCDAHGFEVTALVAHADPREGWAEAMRVIESHHAELIVVATRDHVPPDRVPQLWVVAERPAAPPRHRRPRRPRIMGR